MQIFKKSRKEWNHVAATVCLSTSFVQMHSRIYIPDKRSGGLRFYWGMISMIATEKNRKPVIWWNFTMTRDTNFIPGDPPAGIILWGSSLLDYISTWGEASEIFSRCSLNTSQALRLVQIKSWMLRHWTPFTIRVDAKIIGQGSSCGHLSCPRQHHSIRQKMTCFSIIFFLFLSSYFQKSPSISFFLVKIFARKSLYDYYSGKKSLMDGSLSWGAVDLRCAVMREQSTLRCTLIEWLLFSMDIGSWPH